jgi:hypothetical protein
MAPRHYKSVARYSPTQHQEIAKALSIAEDTPEFRTAIKALEQLATWLSPETIDQQRDRLRQIAVIATRLMGQLAEIDFAAKRDLGASRHFEDALLTVKMNALRIGHKKGAPPKAEDWAPFILGVADIWTAITDKPATCSFSKDTRNYKGRFYDFVCAAKPASVHVGLQSLGKMCQSVLSCRRK